MRRTLVAIAVVAAVGLTAWWWLTRPDRLDDAALAGLDPDPEAGGLVFAAAGCASCHAAPDSEGEARLVLAGGERFPSAFGTFVAPNISPHPEAGIGAWSDAEVVEAIVNGVSPAGAHYYPAFPYAAYRNADLSDVASLVAYLRTLPESDVPSEPHDIAFPFNIRRNLGLWKSLFADGGWVLADATDAEVARGRYLVEALGHCGECHTPRNALGGLETDQWLAGAPNPSGRGRIPNITPAGLDWSEADIAAYLASGFTPDFDTAGGLMAEVVRNTAQLSDADRAAIAAYLKAVPPVE
jgi:mono/diheme cytochrome c family protein